MKQLLVVLVVLTVLLRPLVPSTDLDTSVTGLFKDWAHLLVGFCLGARKWTMASCLVAIELLVFLGGKL